MMTCSVGLRCPALVHVQIPKECSESQVRSWFEPYGSIVSLVVKRNAVAGVTAVVSLESIGFACGLVRMHVGLKGLQAEC